MGLVIMGVVVYTLMVIAACARELVVRRQLDESLAHVHFDVLQAALDEAWRARL